MTIEIIQPEGESISARIDKIINEHPELLQKLVQAEDNSQMYFCVVSEIER